MIVRFLTLASQNKLHMKVLNKCYSFWFQEKQSTAPNWVRLQVSQDKIFRCKRLSTGTNFVHVYIKIWDKGILKFNKFSM